MKISPLSRLSRDEDGKMNGAALMKTLFGGTPIKKVVRKNRL